MLNYYLYRLGQWIALITPVKIGYKIAEFVADLIGLFNRVDRIAVYGNLKAIFPEKSEKEIAILRRKMARNFAKYLVDFFRFSRLDQKYFEKYITVEGKQYFDQALKLNKGAVVLTAHLGNWELGGVVIALLGYKLWVVALEHKNKKVNDFFNRQRQSKGIYVIPFSKAARQCLRLLKENQLVALVGDRDFSEKSIVVDFLGKPTHLPAGPAVFALITGTPIIPGFLIRNPDDTFTLKMEKPIIFTQSLNSKRKEASNEEREQKVKSVIDNYKVVMEDYIRKYPEQWYMFHKFWVE